MGNGLFRKQIMAGIVLSSQHIVNVVNAEGKYRIKTKTIFAHVVEQRWTEVLTMPREWIVPDADLGCDGEYFDYQELVRCRECQYWAGIHHHCGKWHIVSHPEDYCSDGKRGEGAADA